MAGEPVQRRLHFVLDHYGVRPTQNVILNYFGMANEVYTITTANGKYVVKNCFKNNTRELIANEAALIQHLNDSGVPCPKLVPTKKGEPFLEYDGQFYIMSEYMEGMTPTWEQTLTEQILAQSVTAMADYHVAAKDFVPPYESNRIGLLELDKARQWIEDLSTSIQQDSSQRKSVQKMRDYLPRLLTLTDELSAEVAQTDLSVLQKVFIHADLHCYNIIFNDDGSRYNGIVDFDFIRSDYRMVDFYWASRPMIWNYWFPELFGVSPKEESFEPTSEQLAEVNRRSVNFMVEHYRKVTPLPDEELALLPLFIKALPIYIVRFFSLNNSEEECLSHMEWFEWQMKSLNETVTHTQAALEQLFDKNS